MNFPTTMYRNVEGRLESLLVHSEEHLKSLVGKWGNNPMDVGIETHPQNKGVTEHEVANARAVEVADEPAKETE